MAHLKGPNKSIRTNVRLTLALVFVLTASSNASAQTDPQNPLQRTEADSVARYARTTDIAPRFHRSNYRNTHPIRDSRHNHAQVDRSQPSIVLAIGRHDSPETPPWIYPDNLPENDPLRVEATSRYAAARARYHTYDPLSVGNPDRDCSVPGSKWIRRASGGRRQVVGFIGVVCIGPNEDRAGWANSPFGTFADDIIYRSLHEESVQPPGAGLYSPHPPDCADSFDFPPRTRSRMSLTEDQIASLRSNLPADTPDAFFKVLRTHGLPITPEAETGRNPYPTYSDAEVVANEIIDKNTEGTMVFAIADHYGDIMLVGAEGPGWVSPTMIAEAKTRATEAAGETSGPGRATLGYYCPTTNDGLPDGGIGVVHSLGDTNASELAGNGQDKYRDTRTCE